MSKPSTTTYPGKIANQIVRRQNKIIKEVREYIEENTILLDYYLGEHRKVPKLELIGENYNKLKEILDKEKEQ